MARTKKNGQPSPYARGLRKKGRTREMRAAAETVPSQQTMKGRIFAVRVARGLSQRQIAKETGICLSVVNHLELGKRTDLRLSAAHKLAETLGCSTAWLLFGVGDAPFRPQRAPIAAAPEPTNDVEQQAG